jgi:excisionase family DNA binding protein
VTDPSPFLTVEQVAARLGKTKRDAIYMWISTGELKAVNLATSKSSRPAWRIRQADLDQFLADRQVVVVPPPAPRVRRRPDPVTKYF